MVRLSRKPGGRRLPACCVVSLLLACSLWAGGASCQARPAASAPADSPHQRRSCGSDPVVLFDGGHGQKAGNADWTVDGAYSDLAEMLRRDGFAVRTFGGKIDPNVLGGVRILVLPEPNVPYDCREIEAVTDFVHGGGSLLMIADHSGADRNGDGWDAVDILDRLAPRLGIYFHHRWIDEIPLSGPVHPGPLTRWVRRMGIWGGTTLSLMRGGERYGMLSSSAGTGKAVLAGCRFGRGRVVGLTDSSPFDDGTGDPGKKLHDSFNSFLYDIRQMASNVFRWLDDRPPRRLPVPAGIRFLSRCRRPMEVPAGSAGLVMIAANRFNEGADKTRRFAGDLEKLGLEVVYADEDIDDTALAAVKLLVVDNPAGFSTAAEIQAVRRFVERGGSLLLSCRGGGRRARGRQKQLNALLKGLGSSLRFLPAQVFDERDNYGRPWSLAPTRFVSHPVFRGVKRILFWNPCPIGRVRGASTDSSVRMLAFAGPSARVVVPGDARDYLRRLVPEMERPGGAIALIAEEIIGRGRIFLLGTCTYTNYQYTEERRAEGVRDAKGVGEHQTPRFNRQLASYLCHIRRTRVK